MKIIYTLFLFVSAVCFAGNIERVLFDDFENYKASKLFECADFSNAKKEKVGGKNAIEGSASLRLNTLGQSGWPVAVNMFKDGLPSGYVYRFSFKYRVENLGIKNGCNFLVVDGITDGGENKRLCTKVFGTAENEELSVNVAVAVPKEFIKATVSITSMESAKIVIDNLSVDRIKLDTDSILLNTDCFRAMKVLPNAPDFLAYNMDLAQMQSGEFLPFVDKYGQFKHGNWNGKILEDKQLKQAASSENSLYSKWIAQSPHKFDEFFGVIKGKNYGNSKHFRAEKINGKWFFITPKGNLFWSLGVDCVGANVSSPIKNREAFFEDISDKKYIYTAHWGMGEYATPHDEFNFYDKNFAKKYGNCSKAKKAAVARKRLMAWNMNTFGAWSCYETAQKAKMPYALILTTTAGAVLDTNAELTGYWSKPRDFFDKEFEKAVLTECKNNAALMKSPYCLGVFFDNELPWQSQELLLPKAVLGCPKTQPAKIAFMEFLKKKYAAISALNKAWAANYKNWNEFLSERDFVPKTKVSQSDLLAFESIFYDKYFEVCKTAIKAQDPQVLYMGCRFAYDAKWVNDTVIMSAAKYCDVVSFNLYRKSVADFALPKDCPDKPVIIGEFHFGSADCGVFGGGLVEGASLADCAKMLENYLSCAVKNPQIVGAHWFQYANEPVSGRSDGENYNIGLVDICDAPKNELTYIFKQIGEKMYNVRLAK